MSLAILTAVAQSISQLKDEFKTAIDGYVKSLDGISAQQKEFSDGLSGIKTALESIDEFKADKTHVVNVWTELKSEVSKLELKLGDIDQINNDTINLVSSSIEKITADFQSQMEQLQAGIPQALYEHEKKLDAKIITMKDGKDGMDGKDGSDGLNGKDGLPGEHGQNGKDGAGIFTPIWSEGITREGNVVQHNLGQMFKALKDTITEPGTSDDWERVGTLGLRICGSFDPNFDYQAGDIFIKSFSTFMSIGNGKSLLLSARGAKGDTGERGMPGRDSTVPGPAGTGIRAIHTDNIGLVIETDDDKMHPVILPGLVSRSEMLEIVEHATGFDHFKSMLTNYLREPK